MFYKHFVLANAWGRKDGAVGVNKVIYHSFQVHNIVISGCCLGIVIMAELKVPSASGSSHSQTQMW